MPIKAFGGVGENVNKGCLDLVGEIWAQKICGGFWGNLGV